MLGAEAVLTTLESVLITSGKHPPLGLGATLLARTLCKIYIP